MNETKLLQRLQSGDPAALRALMDHYLPYVSTVVWNILRGAMPPEDAEEVASDVFLAAWDHAEALEPGHIKGWLGTVARNRAKNRLRAAGRTLQLEEDAPDIPCPDTPSDELERRETQRIVRKALAALPDEDRVIFLRRYYYAQTTAEIAAALALNESTVRTRLHRGRAKLKEEMQKEGFYDT